MGGSEPTVALAPQAEAAEITDWRPPDWYDSAKRALDVAVALAAVVVFLPLWILIALAIVLTSPGPAIYRQRRVVGKGGKEFTVFKFRTMYANAGDSQHQRAIVQFVRNHEPLAVLGSSGAGRRIYKLVGDLRITPVGKVLRKTGLDEAPQFLNVLRGEMSVVGPRAPLYYEYELYGPRELERLKVVPGITGWYQINGRSSVPFDEMVNLDLEYVRRRSLRLDIKIMLLTPWVMITGRGAY